MELLDSNHQWRDGQRRRNDVNALNASIKNNDNDMHSSSSHKSRRHRRNRLKTRIQNHIS